MQLFTEVRNKYTQAVRKAKASFFKQKFASCSTNSKQFWDTVKFMENKSTSSQLPTALRLGNTVLFLKLSAEIVATPITSLFKLSFVSSEIPKDWKAAAVIRLFNGGDNLDPNCFRPISILPCLSKVFESQVNKQITDHFESHHTFSAWQIWFQSWSWVHLSHAQGPTWYLNRHR